MNSPIGPTDGAAAHDWIDRIFTEAMTVKALAKFFDVHRNKMTRILRSLESQGHAERCGRHWRVVLAKMPPAYLVEQGLLSNRSAA